MKPHFAIHTFGHLHQFQALVFCVGKKDSYKKPVLAGKHSHAAHSLIKYSLIVQRELKAKKRKPLTKAFVFFQKPPCGQMQGDIYI